MTICNLPQKIVGPFDQIIFLGCSVTTATMSLGWGGESSTLQVSLIEDFCHHPTSAQYAGLYNEVRAKNTNTITNQTISNAFVQNEDGTFQTDSSKMMVRNLASEIVDQENARIASSADSDIRGKVTRSPLGPKKYIRGPDPGFIGLPNKFNLSEGYDIIGIPVFFNFHDIQFGGLIHSWRCTGNQGGWATYEVEVRGHSSLLAGSQLIVGAYAGTVSSLIPNTSVGNIGDIAVPTSYVRNMPEGPNIYPPHNSSIAKGNLPNLLNIYGYLESAGFGNAVLTDEGLSAAYIYDALVALLGVNSESIVWNELSNKNSFNPYGSLLSRCLSRSDGIKLSSHQVQYSDIGGNTITLEDMGVARSRMGPDTIRHSMYKLDLSEVPRPPVGMVIPGPNISILDFISTICDNSGLDFFIDCIPESSGNFSGIIKVRTVSKRIQPRKDIIKNIVDNIVRSNTDITTFNYGQSFTDKDTRAMYIGGNQKRLVQVRSTVFATKQNSLVWDPFKNNGNGAFINYGSVGQAGTNQARIPNAFSTRRYRYRIDGGAAVADNSEHEFGNSTTFSPTATTGDDVVTNSIGQGNYFEGVNIATVNNTFFTPGANHPMYTDMICPYFGRHGGDGLIRKVFFDPKMGQMQILFSIKDLNNILSLPAYSLTSGTNDYFLVLENEIRAAGKGFDSWLSYCFANYFTTDIELLIYKYFSVKHGAIAAKTSFIQGILPPLLLATDNHQALRGRQGFVPSGSSDIPYRKLYDDLKKIHAFFANIASEHYGKTYMVRPPNTSWYQDSVTSAAATSSITLGDPAGLQNTIYLRVGSGKVFTDWKISEDGAWEEPGNWIDDTIIVGSTLSNSMADDQGKIPPILGFKSYAEVDGFNSWYASQYNTRTARCNGSDSIVSHTLNDLYNTAGALNPALRLIDSNNFYVSLSHNLEPTSFITIPVAGASAAGYRTAHDLPVPMGKASKTYVKCAIDTDLAFLSATNDGPADSRVIISTPSPLFIGAGSPTDRNLLTVMTLDGILKMRLGSSTPTEAGGGAATRYGGLTSRVRGLTYQQLSNRLIGSLFSLNNMSDTSSPSSNDASEANSDILPKAAVPQFAAIPVEFTQAIYGPWINHPGLISDTIFAGRTDTIADTNNLIGGTKVVYDATLTPWNYGSMEILDNAVMAKIRDDVNYQQVSEEGMVQVPGLLALNNNAYRIGDVLSYEGSINGPIVSNIQIQIGEGGVTTTYSMRTYSRKIGFFNKDNADRLRQFGMESLKRRKEISTSLMSLSNQLSSRSPGIDPNTSSAGAVYEMVRESFQLPPKPLRSSPFEILAGCANPYAHPNGQAASKNPYNDIGYSPGWPQMPYSKIPLALNPKDLIRHQTNVSLQDIGEIPRETREGYASKSYMSLDGIFSPISFYPTPHGATYHITKYHRSGCAFCGGNGVYTYKYYSYNPLNPPADPSSLNSSIEAKSEICPFCETNEEKNKKLNNSSSAREMTPPYVLASGDDLQIISRNALMVAGLPGLSGQPIINYSTLNPILLSVGEFSAWQNRQEGDLTGHSIDLIGQGLTVPEGDDGLKPAYSLNIERSYVDYDINFIEFNRRRGIANLSAYNNNMRFFGLRGPLMLHGWGYDLEGYPVPNASGEPKMSATREIMRDNQGNIIYKNQKQKLDGTWTTPYKENSFYQGWGQLPGTWPVGPIDLRWDSNAGVWTVGSNYKAVWVALETDLVGTDPVRGVIVDDSYDNNPLPEGLRKLVFVKDTLGLNASPRGAAVYCKYDSVNGFYEPIYNRTTVTSGTIVGDTVVEIYRAYGLPSNPNITTNDDPDIESYQTSFKNPMGFNLSIGDVGLFIFMNGDWVLQSYKP